MLPNKFQVNEPLGSGEEMKNRFQDGGHLGFPIETILAIFYSTSHPRSFLRSFKSVGLLIQEKKRKLDFQDGRHDHHLGFQIGTIVAIVNQQVTPKRPTKFQLNWPFGSGEQVLEFRSERF